MVEISFGGFTFGKKSIIKSIQQGTITLAGTSNTASINSVVESNCILYMNGARAVFTASGATVGEFSYYICLTNSTTVTAKKYWDGDADFTVGFTIVEYYPGIIKSRQDIEATMPAGGSEGTANINSVNTSKSFINYRGLRADTTVYSNVQYARRGWARLVLTNSTTVTVYGHSAGGGSAFVISFEVIEFY